LKNFCVLEFILFDIFEDDTVFFHEVEEGVSPNRGSEVLFHIIIDPHLIFA